MQVFSIEVVLQEYSDRFGGGDAAFWPLNSIPPLKKGCGHQMVPHAEETRQIEREPFSVVFYGLRTFDCKIAQFYAMLHESEMTETPGVSNTVQVGENARKTPPLNYESAALPAELRGRSVIHVILGDVLTSVLTSAVTVRFLNARFTYETVIEYGGKGIRTPDFQLAKLALYQLSYAPEKNCGM